MKKKQELPEDLNRAFQQSLSRAVAEMLVLFLLRQKSLYAYEMANIIERVSDGKLDIPTLYNVIYKLKAQGLVHDDEPIVIENRIRVYLSITEKGMELLETMLPSYYAISDVVHEILAQGDACCKEDDV